MTSDDDLADVLFNGPEARARVIQQSLDKVVDQFAAAGITEAERTARATRYERMLARTRLPADGLGQLLVDAALEAELADAHGTAAPDEAQRCAWSRDTGNS